jgi:hypothetical protein
LRLDWCWCRWKTNEKGRHRWGRQVWRRQVGLVRGTRWPAESSAGHMVAWTTIWSHGRFVGWASKPRSSQDYVVAESWVAIGGGYTEFAGFPVVHQKWVPWLIHKAKTEEPKTELQQLQTSLTCLTSGYQSGWWGAPVLPVCDNAVRRLRSGGHASGSQGLRRG